MNEFENSFYKTLSYISAKMSKEKLIGEIDFSKLVENSLDAIFDELTKCRIEIYQKGGTVGKVENVSQDIYIFNTLVECLSVLRNYPDALYVCYISNHNTSDGYFGFFIKSNDNIFSINERFPEAFIGQHQHGRNHRFVENKANGIFPYELLEFTNFDYKGYAKTYTLKNENDKKVSLADLNQSSYITLLITILMIKFRVEDKKLDGNVVYSNFYLSGNVQSLQASDRNELMIVSDNQLVKSGGNKLNTLISKLTTENVILGEFNDTFNRNLHPELKYSECGEFHNNIFIELYGKGFVFNPNSVLIDNSIKMLTDKDAVVNAEFVGNEKELSLQIYYEARRQLAEHIKAEMDKEFQAFKAEFGSARNWWESRINANIERVRDFVIQSYINAKSVNKLVSKYWRRADYNISVTYDEDSCYKRNLDFYNGKPCNCKITISIEDWKDIEKILGENVPKIITGYTINRRYHNNPLLSVVDPVAKIHTPFETTGSFSFNADSYDFKINMFFSKSGLKKYIKDKNIVPKLQEGENGKVE